MEILSPNYAIISSDDQSKLNQLLNYKEIEYIEKPFILETQDNQSFSSTGITSFKNRSGLTGKGTLIGLIDSGIDYTLTPFKDANGNSKILYYWDQSINGTPPEGFKEGTLYTKEDIDKAIKGETFIPVSSTSSHGTHVAGIATSIATEANLIVVRVGSRATDYYSRSTEFMRAIKFILDKSLELNMPVSINISYGSNEGSHRGLSLFEQYIDDMCLYWKNNIVVAAGNNRDKGGHKHIKLENQVQEVELTIGANESIININIWPNFADDFLVYLVNPSNQQTQPISLTSGEVRNSIGTTRIKGYFYPIAPYSLQRRVTFQLTTNSQITPGIWKIVFTPVKIVDGNINIYLPTSEGLSKETRFLTPTTELTVTVPGTASRVLTVGSFNSRTDTPSVFSGEGNIEFCVSKPDLLAPGEDIISFLPGGSEGALSGTSMATPHVTGVCSLFHEWGIINNNDSFLYSAKLKALLMKSARRNNNTSYPDDLVGYGFLNLSTLELDQIADANKSLDYFYRNKKVKKYKKKLNLSREADYISELVVSFRDGFEESLRNIAPSFEFTKLSNQYGIISIRGLTANTIDTLQRVLSVPSLIGFEPLIKLAPLGDIVRGTDGGINANEEIGVNFFKNNPNLSLTGRGVLIAIIGTGIDYTHPDFINPDGTSKILYLWDQTIENETPPEGFNIGREFTRQEINEAIANNNKTLSVDEEGYGTIISGICVGLGNVNSEYKGVAEDADLIVIKMAKIEGYYNNAMTSVSYEYAYRKAAEVNRPLVINNLNGSNNLVGISRRNLSRETFFTRGICIVGAAGNEGNTQTHASGKLDFVGDVKEVEIEISQEESDLQIEIWVDKPDTARVSIISPSGEESKTVVVTDYNSAIGIFSFESTNYAITNIFPTIYSGQQQTTVNLLNVKRGIWKIKLVGDSISNGNFNIYLPNRVFLNSGTRFRNPDPSSTINYPATYSDNITVGAYDSINRGLWQGSSRGPTISGILKPDFIAPGVNIIGPYPGGGYAMITGTAPSAAYASGCIAMFLEYISQNPTYRDNAFVQKIRTIFRAGAIRSDNVSYPNNTLGYGVLNIRNVMEVFK